MGSVAEIPLRALNHTAKAQDSFVAVFTLHSECAVLSSIDTPDAQEFVDIGG
jgi:hypothetical protein